MATVKKVTGKKLSAKTVSKKPVLEQVKNPLSTLGQNQFISKRNLIILIILGLLLLAYYKKSWFVAAIVNGQPITSLELEQRLNQQYRSQILNQIINEKIIEQEAAKKGISVSAKEISDQVAQTENQYGGADSFNQLLSQQGINRNDFVKQIRLQLLVEKMYSSEINPTEDEIKQFMDQNKSDPQATDEAKFKQTATNTVKQQKLQKVFQEKFQTLKQAAKIQIF